MIIRFSSKSTILGAESMLEAVQIQDLGDIIPELLEIKTRYGTPICFQERIEMGNGTSIPPQEVAKKINAVLKNSKSVLSVVTLYFALLVYCIILSAEKPGGDESVGSVRSVGLVIPYRRRIFSTQNLLIIKPSSDTS